jgi:hypothetical protein
MGNSLFLTLARSLAAVKNEGATFDPLSIPLALAVPISFGRSWECLVGVGRSRQPE